jgi:glycine cleavage system H protein
LHYFIKTFTEIAMTNPIPANLKYTTSHEWVRDEGDDTVTVGITDHAQELLGDIVFVELPEQNKALKTGEGCAVVESVKAAADVYCPVAGEVIAVNAALTQTPELVNTDPYGEGWLCRIRIQNKADLTGLMSAEDYNRNIENEAI